MSNQHSNEYIIGHIEGLPWMQKNLQRCISEKKTDLVELIVYGHITHKISNLHAEDISKNEVKQILNQNKIIVKSLLGYGNIGLKRKEIMVYGNKECSIKVCEWIVR